MRKFNFSNLSYIQLYNLESQIMTTLTLLFFSRRIRDPYWVSDYSSRRRSPFSHAKSPSCSDDRSPSTSRPRYTRSSKSKSSSGSRSSSATTSRSRSISLTPEKSPSPDHNWKIPPSFLKRKEWRPIRIMSH